MTYATFDDALAAWDRGEECGGEVALAAVREMRSVEPAAEAVAAVFARVPDRLKPSVLQILVWTGVDHEVSAEVAP